MYYFSRRHLISCDFYQVEIHTLFDPPVQYGEYAIIIATIAATVSATVVLIICRSASSLKSQTLYYEY